MSFVKLDDDIMDEILSIKVADILCYKCEISLLDSQNKEIVSVSCKNLSIYFHIGCYNEFKKAGRIGLTPIGVDLVNWNG